MKLRDHPLMSRGPIYNWPPVWTQSSRDNTYLGGTKTLRGEVGVLRYVNSRISNKCFLVIEHERERYVGCLIFSDLSFCALMRSVLQTHLGRPIQEIGDLDVSHTL